jgi:hypothetical protein
VYHDYEGLAAIDYGDGVREHWTDGMLQSFELEVDAGKESELLATLCAHHERTLSEAMARARDPLACPGRSREVGSANTLHRLLQQRHAIAALIAQGVRCSSYEAQRFEQQFQRAWQYLHRGRTSDLHTGQHLPISQRVARFPLAHSILTVCRYILPALAVVLGVAMAFRPKAVSWITEGHGVIFSFGGGLLLATVGAFLLAALAEVLAEDAGPVLLDGERHQFTSVASAGAVASTALSALGSRSASARPSAGAKTCSCCRGSKMMPCPACKAAGTVTVLWGQGPVPCTTCHQQLQVTCGACRGTGKAA